MKVIALLSGGIDSTVLLAQLAFERHEVEALSIDYGQRHARELKAAAAVAEYYDVRHLIATAPLALLAPTSALTSNEPVPHGHYEDVSMRATVVPNRNMVLLALAASCAIARCAHAVAYAAHRGDHAVYPDCRPAFVHAMRQVLAMCDYREVDLIAPFLHSDKAQIVARGQDLKVPFALTYSCYEGNQRHCGQCGTCVERREAFQLARVEDPTEYAWSAHAV